MNDRQQALHFLTRCHLATARDHAERIGNVRWNPDDKDDVYLCSEWASKMEQEYLQAVIATFRYLAA